MEETRETAFFFLSPVSFFKTVVQDYSVFSCKVASWETGFGLFLAKMSKEYLNVFLHFLVQACKRGNYDIVRLMIENGADCNISSKHQSNAIHFAKQCNNLLVYELLRNHLAT